MTTSEGASKLRQFRLRCLTEKDPALMEMTIEQLRELAAHARDMADLCGPFDYAYTHLDAQATLFSNVAFYRACETAQLERHRELALSRFVPSLGSDLLNLTSMEALSQAEAAEDAANRAGLATPHGRRLAMRSGQWVDLASVLEGWERAKCRALAA